MKHYTLISFVIILLPFHLLSQVTVDEALLSNSETMKLQRGFSMSSGILYKTSFGPFKTVDIHKGKKYFVGRHKDVFLEVKGKKAGIRQTVSTVKSQPFSLTILQEGGDTIISNIDVTTVKGGNHALIEIRSGKASDDESTISYCEDIQIGIKMDSLIWHMQPNDDQHTDYDDFPLTFNRVLTNGVDKITATGAEGFPVKRKVFKNATKGIVFLYNKKQVAALETYPETTMWFSKEIKAPHKQAIAAVMIALLSLSDSTMW